MKIQSLNKNPSESWHFYAINLDLSQFYYYSASHDKKNFEIYLQEYESECTLRLNFENNVAFYWINTEFSSIIRELEIDILMQRDVYWEWPLFEVENSPLIEFIMPIEEFSQQKLRHFIIVTQNFFIDIFAREEPHIVINNHVSCDRKYHTKPAPIMYPPIKKPNE